MITYSLKNPARITEESKSPYVKLKTRYLAYCDSQSNMKIYWYMKAIISLTCVFMVPSIILMAIATDYYVYYVGLAMILFFNNLIVHIIQAKSSVYIPIYHLTCILLVLIPVLTLAFFGANGTTVLF